MHKVSPGGDVPALEKLTDHLVSIVEKDLHSNKKSEPIQGLGVRCNRDTCGETEKDPKVEEKKDDRHLVQEDNILKRDHLEKQKPSDMVVLLHEDLSPLPEELEENSREEMSFDTVAGLQKENRALRESLEQSYSVSIKVLRRVEILMEHHVELKHCLVNLLTERSLLQDEMRKLHQEYISLCQRVKLQLTEGTTSQAKRDESALIQNPGGSSHPPQRPATLGRPPDCSNENSRICSCHFVNGMKSAAPSVFQWSEKKLTASHHSELKEEPEEKDVMSAAPEGAVSLSPAGGEEKITECKEEETTETEISDFKHVQLQLEL